jgi:hypothetical protein
MTKEIKTEILVNASPEKVWRIFTDFHNYSTWNPFILSISGIAEVGNKIKVQLLPPGTKGMTFKPTVLVMQPQKEFGWMGHLLFPGLFDGEHRFELIDNGNGTTTFKQSETLKGILVIFFKKMLDKNTTEGFILMNQKLKEISEKM